jgi:hypothetical protein
MKNKFIFGLIILLGCGKKSDTTNNLNYIESRLSFYDPADPDFTFNTWIRNPKNIKIVHETLKDFGYQNLYTEFELHDSPCQIFGIEKYVLKPCNILVDSLLITYGNHRMSTKYFKEFWERRIKEGNDSIVHEVLKEIKIELFNLGEIKTRKYYVNDTIKNLLRIYLKTPTSDDQAIRDFRFLKSIGLNLSAHNLLYEWTPYENVKWDRKILDKELLRDSTSHINLTPLIPDNLK